MKPAPNEHWKVKTPSIDKEKDFDVSPLRPKRNGFRKKVVSDVPPMVRAATDEIKAGDDESDGLFYSRGHESSSSFTSLSTSSPSCSPSVLSRKSASTCSTKKSKSRRKPKKRQPSVTQDKPAFDPSLKPLTSCMKKGARKPLERQGSFYDVELPGDSVTVERQRTIQYNEEVGVREFQSAISIVKNRDPRVLWWQNDETDDIKDNLQRILARVDKKGIARTNGKRYCTRGLERFVDPSTCCEDDRKVAEGAVFLEQNMQRTSNTFDDLSIAAVYVRSTKRSERQALRRGCEDAKTAASILGEGAAENSLFRNAFSSRSLPSPSTSRATRAPKRSSSSSSAPQKPTSFRKPVSFRRKKQSVPSMA